MELYIGGMSQGKLNYVCNITGMGQESRDICDGAVCSAEELFTKPVINHLHLFIERIFRREKDNGVLKGIDFGSYPEEKRWAGMEPCLFAEYIIKLLIEKNPGAVIICNEVGYGIVPVDKTDRIYRETVGRCLCRLAENSSSVVRIVCGLGMKIS